MAHPANDDFRVLRWLLTRLVFAYGHNFTAREIRLIMKGLRHHA